MVPPLMTALTLGTKYSRWGMKRLQWHCWIVEDHDAAAACPKLCGCFVTRLLTALPQQHNMLTTQTVHMRTRHMGPPGPYGTVMMLFSMRQCLVFASDSASIRTVALFQHEAMSRLYATILPAHMCHRPSSMLVGGRATMWSRILTCRCGWIPTKHWCS